MMKLSAFRILLIVLGAISISSSFAWTTIGGGDDVDVATGKKIGLDGGTGNNYITQNGSIVSITENGKTVSLPPSSMIVGSSDTFSLLNSFNTFTQQTFFRGPLGSAGVINFQSRYNSPVPNNVIGDFYFQNVDGLGAHNFGALEIMGDSYTVGQEQGRLRLYVSENGVLTPYMELNVGQDQKIHTHREIALDTNKKLSFDSGNSANYINYDGTKMKIASSGDICIGTGC